VGVVGIWVLQALSVTEHGSQAEILDLAFRLYDIDGNGTIEMRELAEILRVGLMFTFVLSYVKLYHLSLAVYTSWFSASEEMAIKLCITTEPSLHRVSEKLSISNWSCQTLTAFQNFFIARKSSLMGQQYCR